jgi:predicted nuclease with TOPRIM domain
MASEHNPLSRIHELVDEERDLRARLQRKEISAEEEHARLRELEVQLDQCWDLLRQRRALRETGGDPREAQVRPPDEVEGYLS